MDHSSSKTPSSYNKYHLMPDSSLWAVKLNEQKKISIKNCSKIVLNMEKAPRQVGKMLSNFSTIGDIQS